MTSQQYINHILSESAQVFNNCVEDSDLQSNISRAAAIMLNALSNNNKILLIGNGGSAADCQHIAAELVGRFCVDRAGLPAIALTTDSSILTSVANDYGYDQVFSRQLLALGNPGDVLLAFSTSGMSANILNAMAAAKVSEITSIAFTGSRESPLSNLADVIIRVPDSRTPYIQQVHITIGHAICGLIENAMFSST
jgi:D-sedoheptulose 7-phosphate isomerase